MKHLEGSWNTPVDANSPDVLEQLRKLGKESEHAFTRNPNESMLALVAQGLACWGDDGEFCMLLQADQIVIPENNLD